MNKPFADAQSALGFVIEQGYNVETKVYALKYPNFDYAPHVPVVTEGSPWAEGTIFYSTDTNGKAEWINGSSTDMPFNEVVRSKYSRTFNMFGSGFEWNLEEVNKAKLYGTDLGADKAFAVRRTAEQFAYNVAITGSTEKNYSGLINSSEVSRVTIPVGALAVTTWGSKTAAERYADMNALISGVRTATGEVEYVDTLRLPPASLRLLASTSTGQGDGTLTQLAFFKLNNVYTGETNQELDIKGLRSLVGAGLGGLNRMMVYRKDPEVVRFHLPMPFQMLPARQKSIMGFEMGGVSRTGGTEWRLPSAAAYGDGL